MTISSCTVVEIFKPLPKYGRFSIMKLPSWIFKSPKF